MAKVRRKRQRTKEQVEKATRHHLHNRAEGSDTRAEVVRLRRLGKSYPDIGAALGISKQAAHQHFVRAMETRRDELRVDTDALRELELDRLDLALEKVLEIVADDPDPDTKLKAADRVVRIAQMRAKLLPISAPQVTEVTGKDGGPIETKTLDTKSMSDDVLSAARELARKLATSRGD